MTIKELELEINNSDTWDFDLLTELCKLADMSEEWERANGENFETVVHKAAEKLGIKIGR